MDKLTSRAKLVRDQLRVVKTKTDQVFINKGISISDKGVPIGNVPTYIESIWSENFEFLMNFQLIDQVGSPSIPNTGQEWRDSGIDQTIIVNGSFADSPLQIIDFTPETFTFSSVPNLYGCNIGSMTVTSDLALSSLDVYTDFQFGAIQAVPDELHAQEVL